MRKLARGLLALHQGLWLGLMDRRRLEQLSIHQYRRWRRFSDPEYLAGGLWPWEERAIERHFAGARSVLVAATGGGREQLALARRGLRTTGFDCMEELLAVCRGLLAEAGLAAGFELAPPSAVPAGLGRFDAALIGWGAYMHIPGRAERVRFLGELAGHLPPGGPLLLSFLTRPADSPSYRTVVAVANLVRWLRLSRERVEMGDTLVGTFDHHFRRAELAAELAEAGFELVGWEEEPYGHAVARRRAAG